jgi:hypothetical protein
MRRIARRYIVAARLSERPISRFTERSKPIMKKFYGQTGRLWRLVALAMVIALGTIGVGANSAHASGGPQVPFKGSYSGNVAITGATTAVLSGTGNSTLLGNGPYAGDDVRSSPLPGGGFTDTLIETLTAANGDTLTVKCIDVATPIPGRPGMYQGKGQWTVTGGTGRFSGVTGSGSADALIDLNQNVFSKQSNGTISAPIGN